MTEHLSLVVGVCSVLAALGTPHQISASPSGDEAAILQVAVDEVLRGADHKDVQVEVFVVATQRTDHALAKDRFDPSYILEQMPGLRRDTLNDFERKIASPAVHRAAPVLRPPVRLVSLVEVRELLGDQLDWDKFYERYVCSQGITVLSPVGFSADGSQALVYTGTSSGSLMGRGLLHLLERAEGGWRITESMQLWIS